jgi:hypothetical protein
MPSSSYKLFLSVKIGWLLFIDDNVAISFMHPVVAQKKFSFAYCEQVVGRWSE